jgi:hypothetical protein
MKALYVSDDGKFFTTPEECMEYESKQNGYMVEVKEDVGHGVVGYHFQEPLNNKQNCQHFVAKFIRDNLENNFLDKNFWYNTKIIVRHKDTVKWCKMKDLIEKVPEHYKINSDRFHDLIR